MRWRRARAHPRMMCVFLARWIFRFNLLLIKFRIVCNPDRNKNAAIYIYIYLFVRCARLFIMRFCLVLKQRLHELSKSIWRHHEQYVRCARVCVCDLLWMPVYFSFKHSRPLVKSSPHKHNNLTFGGCITASKCKQIFLFFSVQKMNKKKKWEKKIKLSNNNNICLFVLVREHDIVSSRTNSLQDTSPSPQCCAR